MFIGSKEVKVTMPKGEKELSVEFDDETSTVINKELYDLIKSEEKGAGNVTDNVNDFFARKFLAELAYYELGHYFVRNVANSMEVLAHNLREELFKKTFNCTGGDDINLKLLTSVKIVDTDK
jgi:hypothetical protein